MTATADLRSEHERILRQASGLTGLTARPMTRELAGEAQAGIRGLDGLLVAHLNADDDWLYPLLMAASDPAVRTAAGACFDDVGGVLGVWRAYRDQWSADAILAAPERFCAATQGMMGALALRIEQENLELYPLVDQLADERHLVDATV